jgi:hypothetical protein
VGGRNRSSVIERPGKGRCASGELTCQHPREGADEIGPDGRPKKLGHKAWFDADERAFLAALIAEATNLGLSRMAEVCGAGSRRALLRMQTWHVREETFRTALGCLTDAIHAEPLSAWFGDGFRASADGQAFNLGGPGAAGGQVNAHYGRDTIVKIYTTITDR